LFFVLKIVGEKPRRNCAWNPGHNEVPTMLRLQVCVSDPKQEVSGA